MGQADCDLSLLFASQNYIDAMVSRGATLPAEVLARHFEDKAADEYDEQRAFEAGYLSDRVDELEDDLSDVERQLDDLRSGAMHTIKEAIKVLEHGGDIPLLIRDLQQWVDENRQL